MSINKIQVRNNSFAGGNTVKQIELFAGDLEFRCDVKSQRDINLAERLARESGVEIDLEQGAQ